MHAKPLYYDVFNRDKRHDIRIRARIKQLSADLELSVMVTNVSRGGCKVECMAPINPELPLMVEFVGLPPRRAKIMWSKTGSYGCKFEREMDLHDLSNLLDLS